MKLVNEETNGHKPRLSQEKMSNLFRRTMVLLFHRLHLLSINIVVDLFPTSPCGMLVSSSASARRLPPPSSPPSHLTSLISHSPHTSQHPQCQRERACHKLGREAESLSHPQEPRIIWHKPTPFVSNTRPTVAPTVRDLVNSQKAVLATVQAGTGVYVLQPWRCTVLWIPCGM